MDCRKWQLSGNGDRSFACVSWARVKYLLDGNHRINTNQARSSLDFGTAGELAQLYLALGGASVSASFQSRCSSIECRGCTKPPFRTWFLPYSLWPERVDFSALGTPTSPRDPAFFFPVTLLHLLASTTRTASSATAFQTQCCHSVAV